MPQLFNLPDPILGNSGWPWTEETPPLPPIMPNGSPWPKISIVTPSFNQAQFLEETIRSVLLQGYPNLEYIIIDGGSTDGSVEIIKKYEPWLTYWVSEPDRGQSDAINKGIRRTTGDIFNWVNSDDTFLPFCLQKVGQWFADHPELPIGYGSFDYVTSTGEFERQVIPDYKDIKQIIEYWRLDKGLTQQALFVTMPVAKSIELLDLELSYNMDYEWQCRLIEKYPFTRITTTSLATYRLHTSSKSVAMLFPFIKERASVARRYWPSWFSKKRWLYEIESFKCIRHFQKR